MVHLFEPLYEKDLRVGILMHCRSLVAELSCLTETFHVGRVTCMALLALIWRFCLLAICPFFYQVRGSWRFWRFSGSFTQDIMNPFSVNASLLKNFFFNQLGEVTGCITHGYFYKALIL